MATESNTGFHCEEALNSVLNRHAISFQSVAINRSSEMTPMGSYFAMNSNSPSSTTSSNGMIFPGNSPVMIGTNPIGISHQGVNSPPGSLLLDSVPGLKHEVGLAVEWSTDEQFKLDRGLDEYRNEPNILKYIKIAALLRDKTVRDVALRCRWMARKRRKSEELTSGKKLINRKDKLVESSAKTNMTTIPPLDMAGYPFMNYFDQSRSVPFEGMSSTAKHLLEQNAQVFNQITANLSTYKLQDNIDLFYRTRSNITAILNDMRHMPGIMSQMPPLPVSIDEELASNIMANTA